MRLIPAFALTVMLVLPLASEVREKAPDFTLESINGDTIKLSDYRGKVVILDFWATWCRPCVMEIPHYKELYEAYKDSGLAIIGIALDKPQKVVSFVDRFEVNYPIAVGDRSLAAEYGGIRAIPTTFVLDQDGRIYKKYVGYRSKEIFLQDFRDLKNEYMARKKAEKSKKSKKSKKTSSADVE